MFLRTKVLIKRYLCVLAICMLMHVFVCYILHNQCRNKRKCSVRPSYSFLWCFLSSSQSKDFDACLLSQESWRKDSTDIIFCFSGPGFGIYAVVHLLLPVMSLWLRRSHKDHSYWDLASANFKHAIGLSCELVVEHIQSFIHSGSTCPIAAWSNIAWYNKL